MSPKTILQQVCKSADALVEAAEPYEGLIPSLLDRKTGKMLDELPAPIEGQRNCDRSGGGSNLMHDQVLLRTFTALSKFTGNDTYAGATDRYLNRFANHCTDTVSGLFPWGEHSYWNLKDDAVGDSYWHHDPSRKYRPTHDHLRAVPLWLWDRLWQIKSDCVVRFAEGLNNHWTTQGKDEPREYIRHALIQTCEPYPRDLSSCDFPRHAGFYIFDLAFAYSRSGREDLLSQLRAFADYWWEKRDEQGLCALESRTPGAAVRHSYFAKPTPGQTLSLAVSLAEAADLLEALQPTVADECRQRARVYVDGFFTAPHDLERGIFIARTGEGGEMPIWGSRYGQWPAAYVGLTALCGYRVTGDARLLAWAQAVGKAYARTAFPEDVAVPAMDAGLALGLLADLYNITGEPQWINAGLALADELMTRYLDQPIPRGAAGFDHYESQMGPGFVLHGLARVAMLAMDRGGCMLDADYTAR